MKTTKLISARVLASLAAGAALLTALGTATAAENIVYSFNDAGSATFSKWWGAASQTYSFDASVDADNNPNSGSQKIVAAFDLAAYGGDNQFAAQFNNSTINGIDYTNFVFSIKFDPSSPTRTSGDYGTLEYGLIPSDFSQIQLGSVSVPAGTTGWTTVQARIDPSTPKLDSIRGVWFKIWSGAAGGLTGTSTMWIDNVTLYANTNVAPPPPPTIGIDKANPGLRIFASQPGQQYQRQSIYTKSSPDYSWVGRPAPVTYSVTLADYPDGTHSGFQSHIFLVPVIPGTNLPNWETSADYNEPNLIFLDIGNGADGGGYASFRYKTNQPNGNGMVYNTDPTKGPVGTLASVGSGSPNGTWSITFNNNTDVTITAPNGSTANATLPADAAALFSGPLHIYVGAQPNQPGNIGQSVTLKHVSVSGVAAPLDLDPSVPGSIDGATWSMSANDAAGLVTVSSSAAMWLSWPLPDTGWILQWAESLDDNFWNDIGFATSMNIGGYRRTLVQTAELPVSFFGNYYFQMVRR